MKQLTVFLLFVLFLISCTEKNSHNATTKLQTTSEVDSQKSIELLDLRDTMNFTLVEVKSVNSHQLTEEELQKEKEKIFTLAPTEEHFRWKNPTSGGCVHITENDELTVYNFFSSLDSTNTTFPANLDKMVFLVQGFTWGNSPSVLITSEIEPSQSKTLKSVVDKLFEEHFRIFFVQQKAEDLR